MQIDTILRAVQRGRTDLVCELFQRSGGPTATAEEAAELLRWCCYYGDTTACRLLVDQGQSLSVLGPDLGLNGAAFHGHWQLCRYLLESGASARFTDPETGETPLHSALTNEDRERYDLVVDVLLSAGADPNAATIPGRETGAFMRDAKTRGERPLHRAALFGRAATISKLIEAGADRELLDAQGESPLAWASWTRRPVEVLQLLLYGRHRIHPHYKPLRENLLGWPGAPGTDGLDG